MLFTVSTVKDTLPNLQRFVRGNLAGGIDHMIVFVDSPAATDPDALAFLEEHSSVTCIKTDESWWQGDRPDALNFRQRNNANFAKALLSTFEWAEWIFHIDGDEVVQIDRAALASAPRDTRVARLAPLEAVSQWHWDDDPTFFKRLLDKHDLTLLHELGVITVANNGAYFHGHTDGKVGVRPTVDLWMRLHDVVDADEAHPAEFAHDGLRLLHYESFSGEEFVRKWTELIQSGPEAKFRPGREPRAVALRTLLGKGLPEEQLRSYLGKLYERTTQDDLQTLRELGLLEEVDPRLGEHRPLPFPGNAQEELMAALERLASKPKGIHRVGGKPDRVRAALGTGGLKGRLQRSR